MHQRPALISFILLALFALVSAQSARAQEPAAADGGLRILLPVVSTPAIFASPWPADAAQRQSLNVFLTWQVIHPDWLDATFSVYLAAGDGWPDTLLAAGLRKASYDPYTFAENTLYSWRIVAEKPDGRRAESPVWRFRTDDFPFPPPLGTMVYVPEGEFMMGCDPLHAGFDCFGEQLPLHAVWLSSFWLDKYEVTNLEYRACVAAGVCDNPRRGSLEGEAYFDQPQYDFFPVVFVSHWDAEDYCGWVGKRLPTEAEWEKAARGSIDTRPWPWGDEPWNCTNVNRCRESDEWFTVAVDNMHPGQSPYGALNMAGNTAEWLQDWYYPDYYKESPYVNPVNTTEWNPQWGWKYYSIRGGSFHDNWYYARTNHRKFGHWGETPGDDKPLYRSFRIGIRCASSTAP